MASWKNFPELTYVIPKDGSVGPLHIRARKDGLGNPRELQENADHLAAFGRWSWVGDKDGGGDRSDYIKDLVAERCAPDSVRDYMAMRFPDWDSVGSPFGPFPYLVSYDGFGYVGRAETAAEVLSWVKGLAEAGREVPLPGPEADEDVLVAALEAGPVGGLWIVADPFPRDGWLLVDACDPACHDSVDGAADNVVAYEVCLDALVRDPVTGTATDLEDALTLLREAGVLVRPLWLTENPELPRTKGSPHDPVTLARAPLSRTHSHNVGWQWMDTAETGGDFAEAERAMDASLAAFTSWSRGNAWRCEAHTALDGRFHKDEIGIWGGEDPARACLLALGLANALEFVPASPDEPAAIALAAADALVSDGVADRDKVVRDTATELLCANDEVWNATRDYIVEEDDTFAQMVRASIAEDVADTFRWLREVEAARKKAEGTD